jgi:DNA-binding GntR family transcriptional regulator
MARRLVEITDVLEKEILSGEHPVGELLNELAIAERFGVSRTPVREALLSLASTGLVRLERGRGAIVVGISLQKVFESYEVMSALMGLAAALCAQRLSSFELAQLCALHDDLRRSKEAGDREAYVKFDNRFHEQIVKGAGNETLMQQVAACSRILAAVRHASMESHESVDTMFEEHDAIVTAICAKDPEAARRAMSAHVHLRGDVANQLVSTWREQSQVEADA